MRRIGLAVVLAVSLTLGALTVHAQQTGKVYRIGYLSTFPGIGGWPSFEQGLREHGYTPGQNLVIERRSAEGNPAKLPDLAGELVRLGVEVIVAGDSNAIAPARASTATIPIVMVVSGDPVRDGFVVSLARPGGNVTGLCNVSPELAGKRLELLKQVVPKLTRVAVLGVPDRSDWPEMAAATSTLGVYLQPLKVESHDHFEAAFQLATRERVGGLVILPSPLTNTFRRSLVTWAARTRLPTVYPLREYAEIGGLMAYGPNVPALFRRAATYVDRILKGAKPADLPVEQPTKFELVINLKTAKALGLTIPQTLLLRADQVIE